MRIKVGQVVKSGRHFYKCVGTSASRAHDWSVDLAFQIRAMRLPACVREFPFAKDQGRKWRFDCCWPALKIAVEVDSQVHRIGARWLSDIEKYNAATFAGWRVYRVTPAQVRSGAALQLIERALARDSSQ